MDALVGFGTLLFGAVGLVLAVLMPFFVYGINSRTKETALALKQTNKLLADIRSELVQGRTTGQSGGAS
jgi:hypothetical protein